MRYPSLTANDVVVLAAVARNDKATVYGISRMTGIPDLEVRRSLTNRLMRHSLVMRSEERVHVFEPTTVKKRLTKYVFTATPQGATMLQNMRKDVRE